VADDEEVVEAFDPGPPTPPVTAEPVKPPEPPVQVAVYLVREPGHDVEAVERQVREEAARLGWGVLGVFTVSSPPSAAALKSIGERRRGGRAREWSEPLMERIRGFREQPYSEGRKLRWASIAAREHRSAGVLRTWYARWRKTKQAAAPSPPAGGVAP
jgi:hypothetical protein